MPSDRRPPRHLQAVLMLVLANAFWGLSFPLIKSLAFEHQRLLPGSSTWFVTACMLAPRFLVATLVLAGWQRGRLRSWTGSEARQALGLAAFAICGMFFQNDGLQYTSASTSAFLTQLYAILIPLWVAFRRRRLPPLIVWPSCLLVVAGVAVLARFDWHQLTLGRGEIETLVSSVFFTGQILMLDRPDFAGNRPLPVTFLMFAVEAAAGTALMAATAPRWEAVGTLLGSGPWVGFTLGLTAFCTLGAFLIMNTWQPRITATEAGLIYCLEPLFASSLALFLPALFSRCAGFDYPNESVTAHLLVGGGLITAANLLIQLKPPPKT